MVHTRRIVRTNDVSQVKRIVRIWNGQPDWLSSQCPRRPSESRGGRAFIGALLDVTDNVNAAGAIVPPQAVVRRDGDDPYPVRTRAPRRCPDIANDGAAEHDFWLGDALVSAASARPQGDGHHRGRTTPG